jgi:hypothetical protein
MTSIELAPPVARPVVFVVFVVVAFVTAWLVGRWAQQLATRFVDRSDRRRRPAGGELDTATMTSLRPRETAIDLIATTVRYLAFASTFVRPSLVISARIGSRRSSALARRCSRFAVQRFVQTSLPAADVFEGWFESVTRLRSMWWKAQGVVEAVSACSEDPHDPRRSCTC